MALAQSCRPAAKGGADGREVRRAHRGGARAVPGRAVLAGDQRGRARVRLGPARRCGPTTRRSSASRSTEQTEQVFANLRAILEAAGSGLDRLVKTTVFLADLDDFAAMNEVYARHVGDRPPARATIEVSALPVGREGRDRGDRARRLSPAWLGTVRPASSRGERNRGRHACLRPECAGIAPLSPGPEAQWDACGPRPSSRPTGTPTSTRFAAMLAARRLYPDAVVCLLGLAEPQRARVLPPARRRARPGRGRAARADAIRRLIVVETVHASRLGELEAVALDPAVEKVVFDHHAARARRTGSAPEHAVLSERRGAHDDARRASSPSVSSRSRRSRRPLFALGIHEDTGSLTYPTRDAARRRGARVVPAPRRAAGAARASSCTRRSARTSASCSARCWTRSSRTRSAASRCSSPRSPGRAYVDGDLEPRAQGRRPDRLRRRSSLLVEMDGRVFCVTRSRTPELDASARRGCARRRRPPPGGVGDLRGALDDARARLLDGRSPGAVREPLRGARRSCRRPARTVPPDETVARALVACQRYGRAGSSSPTDGRLDRRRRPRGSRPGDRARPLARAGEGDHERPRRDRDEDDAARRAAAPAGRAAASGSRSCGRRPDRRRRHAQRRPAGARRAGRGAEPEPGADR